MALEGKFVTRVIYLEDPLTALPVAEDPHEQSYFEVAAHDNPLEVADRLGRPMAILRLGGRLPEAEGPDAAFLFGSPPWVRFHQPAVERVAVPPPARGANPPAAPPTMIQPATIPIKTIYASGGRCLYQARPPIPGRYCDDASRSG